ncbi:MAG: ATP-binding protein [Pseudonocardia sp.]
MSEYLRRIIDDELDELLPGLPALSLEGPKGVGKTVTALRRAETVRRLDDPVELAALLATPRRIVEGPPPVLIDEWQRYPPSWDLVRRAVDDGSGGGRFLLTGSMPPVEWPMHSGAGRIVSMRMRPLGLPERVLATPTVSLAELLTGARPGIAGKSPITVVDYAEEIVNSGFPGIRAERPRLRRVRLDGYLDRIAERDFAEQGMPLRDPAGLRRWLLAYAAATATTATFETIRDAATAADGSTPARSTTIAYRRVLEQLWIVDPVPAWLPTFNHIARIAAPAKHHLTDPALAARLLGADADALLTSRPFGPPTFRDGPLLGRLFESLVTLGVRVCAQAAEAKVRHLRLRAGTHEIDLIVERADQRVVAIEVKLASLVEDRDVRHLHWLADQLGPDLLDMVVVTTGPEAYRRRDGVAVVPAALLGP